MYVESCLILVVVNRLSRPIVVLDGLPGLYGFKYDSATACGLPLYLYSYKLVDSATSEINIERNSMQSFILIEFSVCMGHLRLSYLTEGHCSYSSFGKVYMSLWEPNLSAVLLIIRKQMDRLKG